MGRPDSLYSRTPSPTGSGLLSVELRPNVAALGIGEGAMIRLSDVTRGDQNSAQPDTPKEANMTDTAGANSGDASRSGPIVVGVDGSESSHRALLWAVQEAAAHGNRVLAISTYSLPTLTSTEPAYILSPADVAAFADDCRKVLEAEVADASKGDGSVEIDAKVIEGPAARALIDASQHASALVVGSRGHGGFVGLLLGSVSQQCVTHAHCPVVVIR